MLNKGLLIASMRLLTGAFAALLFIHMNVSSGNAAVPDPDQPGPYAVGHSVYVFEDTGRETTDSISGEPVPIFRPVPAYVFYPVDPESIDGSTPKAVYPLDPIHPLNPRIYSPLTLSDEWEEQGMDPAYEEAVPSAQGPFPLVMVSPGWGGHAWSMMYLGPRLASHGFVVVLVYHYGDRFWPWEAFDNIGIAMINRPLDVSFALTNLLTKNETEGDLLHNVIDPDKVAAAGFSFGGYVAAALAGGDDLACDAPMESGLSVPPEACVPVPRDPRIRAIVPLDGAHHLLHFSELARITVPTMGIGEEWDEIPGNIGMLESWQARLHAATRGKPAYRVDITGTDHSSYSNMCEASEIYLTHIIPEPLQPIFLPILLPIYQQNYCAAPLPALETKRIITKYAVAFLKTNLNNEPGYQRFLTPGHALTSEGMVEFFETEKRNPKSIYGNWPDEVIYFSHQPGSDKANALKDPLETAPMPFTGLDLNLE